MIPFGKAKTVREGTDISIISYGALVQRSVVAAKEAEKQGISVEIIDLRTVSPYDWNAIAESVKKTSRVIVAHEDSLSWGYGAEIAARISNELFDYLDAPVQRVAALDSFADGSDGAGVVDVCAEISAMIAACSAGDTVIALPLRPRLKGATIGTLT